VKTVSFAMSGELTVTEPTWVLPIEAVKVSELKSPGLPTFTVIDSTLCALPLTG